MNGAVVLTPTGSENIAWGQRRSRATPGKRWKGTGTLKGFHKPQSNVCNPFRVVYFINRSLGCAAAPRAQAMF